MSQGECPYCGRYQTDLEGHCNTFHHMPLPQPTAEQSPKTSMRPLSPDPTVVNAPPLNTPMISTHYCPTCGKKQSAQTWREIVIAFARYGLTVFWAGAFVGALSGFEIASLVFHH